MSLPVNSLSQLHHNLPLAVSNISRGATRQEVSSIEPVRRHTPRYGWRYSGSRGGVRFACPWWLLSVPRWRIFLALALPTLARGGRCLNFKSEAVGAKWNCLSPGPRLRRERLCSLTNPENGRNHARRMCMTYMTSMTKIHRLRTQFCVKPTHFEDRPGY